MRVKFTCRRVLINDEPRPTCVTHGGEIQPGWTYLTVGEDVHVCDRCLRHMNKCKKLFQGTRGVTLEKEIS